jgi:hypothetical protein
MTSIFRRRIAGPLVIAVLSTVPLAMPSAATASTEPIQFNLTVSGTSTLTSPTSGDLAGGGVGSHLGPVTSMGQVTAHPDQPSGSCPGGFASLNHETLTAAGGDQLEIVSQDIACPQGPGQFRGTGEWTVVGGTGRFAAASGNGAFDGVVDFVAGTSRITYGGSLWVAR